MKIRIVYLDVKAQIMANPDSKGVHRLQAFLETLRYLNGSREDISILSLYIHALCVIRKTILVSRN